MQDLCPLCLKSGIRKKIKLLQINLQEAVWMCEEEKCIWPFGYEDFVFCPRAVGKNWSYYWDDYKLTTSRLKENVTSVKPLVNVNHDLSKDIISNLDIHSSENINVINNSSNLTDTKTIFNDTFTSGDFVHIEEQCKEDVSNREVTTNNINVIGNNIENTKLENECTNSLNRHNEEKHGISIQNTKNTNNVRETPKITSIEKTNIDISNVKIGNQISLYQESYNEVLNINKPRNTVGTKLTSENEKLSNLETKSNETIPKSNLSITMMEIDGLPPITLSFEIPVCSTIPETVAANTQQTGYKDSNPKLNSPQTKNAFMKRNITSGKQYEKFSFSVIKKKIESNKSNNINNSNNNSNSLNVKSDKQLESNHSNKSNNDSNSSNENTNSKIENVKNDFTSSTKTKNCENFYIPSINNSNNYKQTIPSVSTTYVSNQLYNSITCLSSQENMSDNLAVNTSMNIDTVLEDFLTNDYNVSEDINDEWIDSLLS